MATIAAMLQLGNSVEPCIIAEWLVSGGDTVAVNQTLCSVETDKSTMEAPNTDTGTVLRLLWAEGDEVPVKDLPIILDEASKNISALVPFNPAAEEASTPQDSPEAEVPEAPTLSFATTAASGAISPRARALAGSKGIDISSIAEDSGLHGRIIERDVQAVIAQGPAYTSAATQFGGTAASGTGFGGRATIADPLKPVPQAPAPLTVTSADFPGVSTTEKLEGVREVAAQRTMASLQESVQLTLDTSANAQGLLALRKKLKNVEESLDFGKTTLNDFVCYAVVETLPKYPVFNATLEGLNFTLSEQVHLAFAIDTLRGFLIPAIRSAQSLFLRQFFAEAKRLASEATEGIIAPDYLSGGTFTATNIGPFGIESFTPVINRPQTAILGVVAITPRPVVTAEGEIGVEQCLGLSLTIDYQVIDDVDGARFLKDLVRAIENTDITVLA